MATVKVKILHPIIHNGLEYSRGVHDLDEVLADDFITRMPHAAAEFKEAEPVVGTVVESADAAVLRKQREAQVANDARKQSTLDALKKQSEDEAASKQAAADERRAKKQAKEEEVK